jgi:ribosomal subunit interface protein
MDITFKGRHTSVPERFRRHAAAKLAKLEKLDHKAMRIDVEVSRERNPRQSDRSERVELTVRSRGPAIRAEAAADDRYAALDLAFAKLEARLRRAAERRKARRTDLTIRSAAALSAGPATDLPVGSADVPAAVAAVPDALDSESPLPEESQSGGGLRVGVNAGGGARVGAAGADDLTGEPDMDDVKVDASGLVPIQMEGDGPLIVREKFHASHQMTIEDALLEMELVGHDFYAFHDKECGRFSVVYRRRGYDYGVIRLVETEP